MTSSSKSDVRRFQINLDLPPSERWAEVIKTFKPVWPEVVAAMWAEFSGEEAGEDGKGDAKSEARVFAETLATNVLAGLEKIGLRDLSQELQSIAQQAGLSLAEYVLLNLSYESQGCTSVVTHVEGKAVLARTMDWANAIELRALTVEIDFWRDKKPLYTCTTFAGYLGVLTAQRPGAYALAVNYREGSEDSKLSEDFSLPIGFAVRRAFESCATFEAVVEQLSSCELMAPCYFVVCGADRGELITRTELTEERRLSLAPPASAASGSGSGSGGAGAAGESKGERKAEVKSEQSAAAAPKGKGAPAKAATAAVSRTVVPYLVQANLEHWVTSKKQDVQESLPRSALCHKTLKTLGGKVSEQALWQLLFTKPIWDAGTTIHATVMCPATGRFTTVVRNPLLAGTGKGKGKGAAAGKGSGRGGKRGRRR